MPETSDETISFKVHCAFIAVAIEQEAFVEDWEDIVYDEGDKLRASKLC